MDQLKQFMAVLKKHHFWVLSGLVALIGLAFWWTATSGLSSEFEAGKSKIASKISDVEGVLAIGEQHPNQKAVTRIDAVIEREKQEVLKAWEALYKTQKEQLFKWPEDVMGEDFVEHVENPATKEFRAYLRDRYADRIPAVVATLADIVDAVWMPTSSGMGASGSMMSMPDMSMYSPDGSSGYQEYDPNVKRPKVEWNAANQKMILDWFTWTETPSTIAVKVAQEDLWCYQALCNIIAETNDHATGAHDAAVTKIDHLNVGYDAAEPTFGGLNGKRITVPGASATGGGEMGGMESGSMGMEAMAGMEGEGGAAAKPPRPVGGGGGGSGMYGGMSSMGMMEGMTGEASAEEPETPEQKMLSWRYVDETGKPMTASELEASTMVGYRLLPFRMSLMVDQRHLDKLLIMCRNSLLPVVVREVRYNPTVKDSMGGGGGMYGGGMMESSSMPDSMAMYSGGGGAGTGRTLNESHIKPVEIRGVIYLVQPPDYEKLSAAAAGEAPPQETDAEATATDEAAAVEPGGEQPAEDVAPSGETTLEPADASAPAEAASPPEGADPSEPEASGEEATPEPAVADTPTDSEPAENATIAPEPAPAGAAP